MKRIPNCCAAWVCRCHAVSAQKPSDHHSARHHAARRIAGPIRGVRGWRNPQSRQGRENLTLKHGPIQSLDMPAMTMVYRVKDPSMLDQLKAGDKVKFQAENRREHQVGDPD